MKKINFWFAGGFTYAEIALILTLSVAFCELSTAITYPLMAIWIALACAKAIINNRFLREKLPLEGLRDFLHSMGILTETRPKTQRVLQSFMTYNMGSRVVIYLYTIMLVVLGLTERRFLSSNIMTFINGVSAISVIYLFGKRGVKCSFIALCLAWLFSAASATLFPSSTNIFKNMEFHDLAFGAGYVFLYYLFCHKDWNKKNAVCFTLVTALIILAAKRIGLAGLAVTVVIWVILRLTKQQTSRTILRIGQIAAIVACYLFVVFIVEGWLVAIFEALGINPMGRNYYYNALAEKCEISPFFLGLGRNASATLFTTDWGTMRVDNVHSDILRMYAECGFILFGLWLLVYWWFLPRALEKKFGYRAMEFFVLCTVYTFIVYTTDNTELYLVNQYFYMLVPMHVVLLSDHSEAPLEKHLTAFKDRLAQKKQQK